MESREKERTNKKEKNKDLLLKNELKKGKLGKETEATGEKEGG